MYWYYVICTKFARGTGALNYKNTVAGVCAGLSVVHELKPEMVDNCSSPDLPSGKL